MPSQIIPETQSHYVCLSEVQAYGWPPINIDERRLEKGRFIGVDRRLNMLLYYCALLSSQVATILPRPKSEGRKSIAQCASTGTRAQDALAPERGVRIRTQVHLSPRSGAG